MLRVPYDHDEYVEFRLLPHRRLTAIINAREPGNISWTVRIECGEARFRNLGPKSTERLEEQREYAEFLTSVKCHAEIFDLVFPIKTWRDLESQTLAVDHTTETLHPIMPDLSGVFYFDSQHHATNRNRIAIGSRDGCVFRFAWSFDAEESEYDITEGVEIKSNVALREMRVVFPDGFEPSTEKAMELATRFAEPHDLGTPKVLDQRWVIVPLKAEVD